MTPEKNKKHIKTEAPDTEMVGKINAVMAKLESSLRWKMAPEDRPEYASLKGKKILMVDDSFDVLESYAPELVVATEGHASCIHYHEHDKGTIVEQIMEGDPEVVLLDFHLSTHVKGPWVAQELIKKGFKGKIIGFSSENKREVAASFKHVGVDTCIEKDGGMPEESVKQLAEILKEESETK